MALPKVFIFAISAPAVIVVYLLVRNTPAQAIFNYVTQIALSIVLSVTVTLLNGAIAGTQLTDARIRVALYALVIALELRFVRKPFLRLTLVLKKGWGILSLIPVTFCLLIVFVGLYPEHFVRSAVNAVYVYCVMGVMIVVYFSVYQSLIAQHRLRLLTHDEELLHTQVASLSARVRAIRETEARVRIERHDLRHRLQTIASLVEKDDRAGARAYIGASTAHLDAQKPVRRCVNSVLDAVLDAYLRQAEAAGIAVKAELAIQKGLPVDAAEFSTVFANALENAIHACEKLPREQRALTVKCRVQPTLMLDVANACDGTATFDRDGHPIATEKGHGVGARSIAAFVEKYSAWCAYEMKDGWFSMRISL